MSSSLRSPELDSLMQQCFLSTKVAAKVFYPDRFYRPFSPISEPIFRALDDNRRQKVVISAPRGWGKSSTVNYAFPTKRILFRENKFIVPVSATSTQAMLQGKNLRRALTTNKMIRSMFGEMQSEDFSQEQWVTSSGTMVMPRGAGQQVRGIAFGDYRPDLIIADDFEDAESVMSEEQRNKKKHWFYDDLMKSVDLGRDNWKIVVVGTPLHEAALLVELLSDPSWYHISIALCDENRRSNWPEYISDEQVEAIYQEHVRQGMVDSFYREYMGIVNPQALAAFKSEYFKYYDEPSANLSRDKDVENVVIMDPAKTVNPDSAETAIVGLGANFRSNAIYVRDVVSGKFHPDQSITEAINMCARINARVLAIEVTSLNEFITYPIQNEIIRRGLHLQVVELKARDSKERRVSALIPFYRQGLVFHNPTCCKALEAQLMAFPRARLWDIMDATAYIVELLHIGERFFYPSDDYDEMGIDEVEKEFSDLADEQDDEQLSGWRLV